MKDSITSATFKLTIIVFFCICTGQFACSSSLTNFDTINKAARIDTLRDSVSVVDFGAKGDKITDNFMAIQAAIDFIALRNGGTVFFPQGTYLVKGKNNGLTDGLNISTSNITLKGEGSNSIIQQDSSSFYALSINKNNTGTNDVRDNARNIKITGIKFICDIRRLGFSEFKHMVNIHAASDVVISHCIFEGFRGDGVLIGSGNTAGIERHNENITITNCIFDGVNNDNRNGISVIDVNGLLIDSCIFRRIARANMPGAIDIEPDEQPHYIVKNIVIKNNKFDSIGGNSAAISYNGNTKLKEQINNLTIVNNEITNGLNIGSAFTFQTRRNPTSSTPPNNIIVKNNRVKNYYQSIQVFGIKNIIFDSNIFDSILRNGVIGFTDTNSQKNAEVKLYNNTFINNGYKSHAGLTLFTGNNIELKNNVFEDCGSSFDASANAIDFKGSSSDNVILDSNISRNKHTHTSSNIQRESINILVFTKDFFTGNKLILAITFLMAIALIAAGYRNKREVEI